MINQNYNIGRELSCNPINKSITPIKRSLKEIYDEAMDLFHAIEKPTRMLETIQMRRPLIREMVSFSYHQLPEREPRAYFYYFTDPMYKKKTSKFKRMDDRLVLLGRERPDVMVVAIDRDRVSSTLWDVLVRKLEIKKYPALIISSESLEIEKIDLSFPDKFSVPPVKSAIKFDRGIISDRVYKDEDNLSDFLNDMYDGAKENNLEERLRKQKILGGISITIEQIKDLILPRIHP